MAKKPIRTIADFTDFSDSAMWREELASLLTVEDWHEVGAAGEPIFNTNWGNYTAVSTFNTAAFYKDPFGVVHLKGLVYNSAGTGVNTTIYTLPTGYFPSKEHIISTIGTNIISRIDVDTSGNVRLTANGDATAYLSLDGITFRAAQ